MKSDTSRNQNGSDRPDASTPDRLSEDESDEYTACPHSGSACIKYRTGKQDWDDAEPDTWRCEDCTEIFDEPDVKHPDKFSNPSMGGISPIGKKLLEYDGDLDNWVEELSDDRELATDGGQPRHVVIVPEDPANRPSIEEIQERFGVKSNGTSEEELPEIDGEALVQELEERIAESDNTIHP